MTGIRATTKWAALTAAVVCGLAVAGCGSGTTRSTAGGRVSVVTTTSQLTDFAKVVGGPDVSVYSLLKPNVDPHDYEPSPADLDAINSAAVVVRNGVGLEHWFDDVVRSAEPSGRIVDASKGVMVRDEDGGKDPHIWQDPRNAKVMVANLTDALAAVDADHAEQYRSRAAAYSRRLDELDGEIATKIDGLANKKLVTNHDAFGYYVDRYGLEFVGSVIPSFDTNAELSASELADLVTKIKAEGVKAVFSESSLPSKTANAIAKEAGVKVVQGDNALYGDSLGPVGSDAADYLSMMRHNTDTIVENLS